MKLVSALFVLCVIGGNAMAADYQLKEGSTLTFTGIFQGEEFSGKFPKFEAQIRYDSSNIESSMFDVVIDLASVSTGDKDRDDALPGSEFFNVGQFPNARFVTRQFTRSGDKVTAEGTLTIKNISKPVNLEVKFNGTKAGGTLDVMTTVSRLDFNVGSGDYADTSTIADEVEIKAHLELSAK